MHSGNTNCNTQARYCVRHAAPCGGGGTPDEKPQSALPINCLHILQSNQLQDKYEEIKFVGFKVTLVFYIAIQRFLIVTNKKFNYMPQLSSRARLPAKWELIPISRQYTQYPIFNVHISSLCQV